MPIYVIPCTNFVECACCSGIPTQEGAPYYYSHCGAILCGECLKKEKRRERHPKMIRDKRVFVHKCPVCSEEKVHLYRNPKKLEYRLVRIDVRGPEHAAEQPADVMEVDPNMPPVSPISTHESVGTNTYPSVIKQMH